MKFVAVITKWLIWRVYINGQAFGNFVWAAPGRQNRAHHPVFKG